MSRSLSSMRKFCDCLSMIAAGPIETYKPTAAERDVINRLKDSGLVFIGAATLDGTFYQVDITPFGASQLAQWDEFLRSQSLAGKLKANFWQAFWIVFGALITNADRIAALIA